jgi:hypothetical protein
MTDLNRTQLEGLFYDNSPMELFRGYKDYIKKVIEEEQRTHKNIKIMPFYEWRKLQNARS